MPNVVGYFGEVVDGLIAVLVEEAKLDVGAVLGEHSEVRALSVPGRAKW
jgi:hypothetical protein